MGSRRDIPGEEAKVELRQVVLVDQEIHVEGGRSLATPTRRVAAAAVLRNPFAEDLEELIALSVEAGELLTKRVLAALDPLTPRGYGKAALVGLDGDLEHGAAMIHARLGLAMRQGVQRGRALIPGNAKVGPAGSSIDIIFGGIDDGWDYDAMDAMTISVPDAPKPGEILLAVAFLAGTRPNARVAGAPEEVVARLVEGFTH